MSHEPIPAAGAGAASFDQPSLFYLTNKKLIDEWAALREVAAHAVGDWLRTSFRDAFASAVIPHGLEVSTIKGPPSFRNVLAHPTDMPRAKGKPALAVGIGWSNDIACPTDAGSIFVCVRASRTKTGAAASAAFLAAGGNEFRSANGLKGTGNADWPVFRNLRGPEGWWNDLDSYRDSLLTEAMFFVDGTIDALRAAAAVGDLGGPDEPD